MPTVGVIGLGLLGTAISTRLLDAGYAVLGFDVSIERRQWLAVAGGRAADSAIDVARGCDVLLFSLPDQSVVASVIESIEPVLRAGETIIDTTTGDPWQAEALGAWLAERGIDFLDATVVGSSAQMYQRDVLVLAGGQPPVYERAGELFATFARESFRVGPWGAGSRMKLVVNLVLGLNRAALAEALTLAEALELDPSVTLNILRVSAAYSRVMDTKGQKMLDRDFEPQARLSQHLKDVRLILAAAERTGATLPLSLLHRTLLEQVEAAGHGQLDNSAILLAFREPPAP